MRCSMPLSAQTQDPRDREMLYAAQTQDPWNREMLYTTQCPDQPGPTGLVRRSMPPSLR